MAFSKRIPSVNTSKTDLPLVEKGPNRTHDLSPLSHLASALPTVFVPLLAIPLILCADVLQSWSGWGVDLASYSESCHGLREPKHQRFVFLHTNSIESRSFDKLLAVQCCPVCHCSISVPILLLGSFQSYSLWRAFPRYQVFPNTRRVRDIFPSKTAQRNTNGCLAMAQGFSTKQTQCEKPKSNTHGPWLHSVSCSDVRRPD